MRTKNKGFTLIELVVAIGLIAVLGAFTIVSLSAVPQTRMREAAQTIKSEFELTRNYAKTHGGDAVITLKKVDEGLEVTRSGDNMTTESTIINDRNFALFYKLVGEDEDDPDHELGKEENSDIVKNGTLEMTFAQTSGSMIGPHFVDYIIISNGSKNYKFILQHESGMIYYDYELDDDMYSQNETKGTTTVNTPCFIVNGALTTDIVSIKKNQDGNSVQPEISYDSTRIKLRGVYRAIDVGTYEITFELKDPYSTTWTDKTTDPITLVWKIVN